MKKYILFLSLFFLLSNIMAFMPLEHYQLVGEIINSSDNSVSGNYFNACKSYPTLCLASSMENDVGVIFYYTNSPRYNLLHSPAFCQKMLDNVAGSSLPSDQALACAIGSCLHMEADLASHSTKGMVQYSISHTLLPNSIIHVFAEQHLDNWVRSKYPDSANKYETSLLDGYLTCEPLYVQSMFGSSEFAGLSKADIEGYFDTFIHEVVTSQTGYDPGFKDKSLFVTIKSIPITYVIIYLIIMLGFLFIEIILIIKIIKKQGLIRHWIGLIIFGLFFGIMVYLFIGLLNGNAFGYFINLISPISNLVPIGNPQTYLDKAHNNLIDFFNRGQLSLQNTDPSGMGANPVLINTTNSVAVYSYIALGIIILLLIWFIWFILKKNRIISRNVFNL